MKHTSLEKDRESDKIPDDTLGHVQTERYHNLTTQLLSLVNRTKSSTEFIHEILYFIKVITGFEAVGIRLRGGEDFPYYETIGFSKDFVQAERYLCSRDQNGEVIHDSKGKPYLECMCGNILSGRTDSSLPFFTEGGSFWTNSTTELLASTSQADRQSRTRNRCNSEGYESVALIPLRYGKNTVGLLQLNDRRNNIFTASVIRFFEGVGASIGVALEFKQICDTVHQSNQNHHSADETIITFHDIDFNITRANECAKEMLGLPPLDGQEKIKCYEYYHGRTSPPKKCPSCRCLLTREPVAFEVFESHLNKYIEIRAYPQFDRNGEFSGLIHFVRDTTDRHVLADKRQK